MSDQYANLDRAVKGGWLKAVEIGRNRVKVSHIQYADDTMFIAEGGTENVEIISWLLKKFELVSGPQG